MTGYNPQTKPSEQHPMQPIELVDSVARFKENKIVRFLLDAGPFDLNQIRLMNFSNDDYTHLMQLIGYSVSGYGDLSESPPEIVAEADRIVEEMLRSDD